MLRTLAISVLALGLTSHCRVAVGGGAHYLQAVEANEIEIWPAGLAVAGC